MLKKLIGSGLVLVVSSTIFFVGLLQGVFADILSRKGEIIKDINGHWAYDSINKLAQEGILAGYDDATIKPNNNITRAEFAKLVALAKWFDKKEEALEFTDKKDIPEWAIHYIDVVTKAGIIKGYEDNTFRCNNLLTRAEAVTIITRMLGENIQTKKELKFKDTNEISEWAKESIEKAQTLGLVKGYSDNTFRPNSYVTRAEVFSLIAKTMELLPDKEEPIMSKDKFITKLKSYLPEAIISDLNLFRKDISSEGETFYMWSKLMEDDYFLHKLEVELDENGLTRLSYKDYRFIEKNLKEHNISKEDALTLVNGFSKDFFKNGETLKFENIPAYPSLYDKDHVESWVAKDVDKEYLIMVNLDYGFVTYSAVYKELDS